MSCLVSLLHALLAVRDLTSPAVAPSGVQEIAGSLTSLLQAAAAGPRASADARERLTRAVAIIAPVAGCTLPPPPAEKVAAGSEAGKGEEEAPPAAAAGPQDPSSSKLQPLPDRQHLPR